MYAVRSSIAVAALAVWSATAARAQLPGTDIFVAPFSERGGKVVVGEARNATARPGYDNQPWFLPGGDAFLFASADSSGSPDIYRCRIGDGSTVRVTDTPEGEYSPALTPGGGSISCVRVEHDGTQRLWRFDLGGRHPEVIAAGVDSVGYYAWCDEHTAVVFIVGDPHTLRVVDTITGSETLVAADIGRSLQRIPGRDEIAFLARSDGAWTVFGLDADTGTARRLGPALEGSEDFAWTPAGRLVMARGSELFELDPAGAGPRRWSRVASFGGLGTVTRIAVDPTGRWIALVSGEASQ